ncbi:(2Fe-2S)-binding protein [Achromobacter sp. GG226]|uniref:IucA/IucC family C-terminal-domain containing protein n=1 Tax=Verticiella alkaliphila TaxID=2779529 RepID=UPI001C0D7C3F|nr:(2Fe-2S)-binding protein [Verticiella sp. GG226]
MTTVQPAGAWETGLLADDERALLAEELRLVMSTASADAYPPVAQLLDVDVCRDWLNEVRVRIDAPSLPAAASLFAKRWSFLITGAPLYAMSVFDKGLRVGLDKVGLDADYADRLWVSRLRLRDAEVTLAPLGPARDDWRLDVTTRLFAGHVAPLWRALSVAGGVAERILWENLAVRAYSLYEGRLDAVAPDAQARAQADFDWLRRDAPPAAFGLDHNPLKRYDFAPTPVPGRAQPVRFRKTCCLYYQVPHAREYCRACPLIKPGRKPPVVFD